MRTGKRWAVLLAVLGVMILWAGQVSAAGLAVPKKTPGNIEAFVASHPSAMPSSIYEKQPVLSAPYAPGQLNRAALTAALNALKQFRYAAGVSADVTLSDEFCEKCQAGALINAVNGVMTHYPEKPAGMSDELYELGYSGTSASNIARGYEDLVDAMLRGWMHDGDASNITRVGHRRWALNPRMVATGFGQVGAHKAMYDFGIDYSASVPETVAWPAQTMPLRWMSSDLPWHVSFANGVSSNVRVTLKRRSDGKTWHFSNSEKGDGYFIISDESRGTGVAVIFRPNSVTYRGGDVFDVKMENTGNGTLQYTVEIYSSADPVPERVKEVTVDGGVYVLNHEKKTASFQGPAEKSVTSLNIRAAVKANDMTYQVTEIRADACSGLAALTKVSIGKKVARIGARAFSGCTALKTVTGGAAVKEIGSRAFASCSALSSVPAFAKLTAVGTASFFGCRALEKVTISAGVKSIGKKAFYGCSGLRVITVKTARLTEGGIGSDAFKGISKAASFRCPQKKLKAYARIFRKRGAPKNSVFQ